MQFLDAPSSKSPDLPAEERAQFTDVDDLEIPFSPLRRWRVMVRSAPLRPDEYSGWAATTLRCSAKSAQARPQQGGPVGYVERHTLTASTCRTAPTREYP